MVRTLGPTRHAIQGSRRGSRACAPRSADIRISLEASGVGRTRLFSTVPVQRIERAREHACGAESLSRLRLIRLIGIAYRRRHLSAALEGGRGAGAICHPAPSSSRSAVEGCNRNVTMLPKPRHTQALRDVTRWNRHSEKGRRQKAFSLSCTRRRCGEPSETGMGRSTSPGTRLKPHESWCLGCRRDPP